MSDPSGQKLQGKMMYGQMYRLLRGMSSLALRNDSAVNARIFYDEPNAQIKVKVNADLIIAGGSLGVLQRNNELVLAEDLNDQGAMWLVRAALRRRWHP